MAINKTNKKGQVTIIALIMLVVFIIVYSALIPTINSFISDILPHVDDATGAIVQLFPFLIIVLAVVAFLSYGKLGY